VDIAESWRYDVRVGGKHHVGFVGFRSNARLVWIELCVELPKDLFSVVLDQETGQPVQIEYACHQGE
jgi:hypothetical protein